MRVLALDVGSSSTRAIAFDELGRELGDGGRSSYDADYGRDGAAERLLLGKGRPPLPAVEQADEN